LFKLRDLDLKTVVGKLKKKDYFTLIRYKDGEFYAIEQNPGRKHNCDKHAYYPAMGKALLNSLVKNHDYVDNIYYGMQTLVFRKMYNQVDQLFQKNGVHVKWYDSDLFHRATRDGELYTFIETINNMNVVIVGPSRLTYLKGNVLKNAEFIEVPQRNCWNEKDRIVKEIKEKHKIGNVYLFSSSMPTAVMIHELFPIIGNNSWMIDFGSIWEGLININIRNYYKAMTQETRERNLGK